jgi:protein-S-isoprenylcysteine O-methyltransferase Ste14
MFKRDMTSPPDAERGVDGRSSVGAVAMLVGLPLLVYYVWICLSDYAGALVIPTSVAEWARLLGRVPAPTPRAVAIVLGWLLIQGLLHVLLPGKRRDGMPLADGARLPYKMNGWLTWWLTWAGLAALVGLGGIPATILADQLGPLLTAANLVAFALSAGLCLYGRAPYGGPAAALRCYVIGTDLNPRIGLLDLKFFFEGRPGLIGWIAINLSLAAKQRELHGLVTTPMILVNAFALLYVADYFWNEEAILTTWDIRHERFGWMLCWGNLVWVPFIFTIQAQYLVGHPRDLPRWGTVCLVVLDLVGYAVFRGANLQKHRFRLNPDALVWGRKPEYIATADGSRLLVSGWWGRARHLNYLGDLLMALAWCLPCGFAHPLPYFYLGYSVILLVHRERRDCARCAAKYGQAWDAYCRRVPWRIVPGLY